MNPDVVYPSSKPPLNGMTNNPTTTTTTQTQSAATTKPPLRHPYRPQHQYHHPLHRRRSHKNICCCCCFWTILILLAISLLAAIAGCAFYILYKPHAPQFSISSLRISKLNLTVSSSSSSSTSSHISSLFNLTLSSLNPNSHISFFYDSFTLSCFSAHHSIFIANSSIPGFDSKPKNETVLRSLLIGSEDLNTQEYTDLRSDLRKNGGVSLRIKIDTKVKVKMGGSKSKGVGIRVTCDGIKAVPLKGKSPTLASVSDSKCKVDLRIKIWKWTF